MDDSSDDKLYSCGICGSCVESNSVLCVQCGKWMHSRCEDGDPEIFRKFNLHEI